MQVTKREFEERVQALMYPEVHKIALRLKEGHRWILIPTDTRKVSDVGIKVEMRIGFLKEFYWSEFDYICTTQSYHDGVMFYCEGRRIILV